MITFIKDLFSGSAKTVKNGIYSKLYLCYDKSIYLKINFNSLMSCSDLIDMYCGEIIDVMLKKLNSLQKEHIEELHEFYSFFIKNDKNVYTQIKLKPSDKPHSIISKSSDNCLFLIKTKNSNRNSSFMQKTIFPKIINPINKSLRIKELLKNSKRDGELKMLIYSSHKFIARQVYLDNDKLSIVDNDTEEIIILNLEDIKNIHAHEGTSKLKQVLIANQKATNVKYNINNIKLKEFVFDITMNDEEIFYFAAKNGNDLKNWVEVIYYSYLMSIDKSKMNKLSSLIVNYNNKLYKREILITSNSFSRQGFLSIYLQTVNYNKLNRMLDLLKHHLNINDSLLNIDENSISNMSNADNKYFLSIKIFIEEIIPLLNLIFQYKLNVKLNLFSEAKDILNQLIKRICNINEETLFGISFSTLFVEANKLFMSNRSSVKDPRVLKDIFSSQDAMRDVSVVKSTSATNIKEFTTKMKYKSMNFPFNSNNVVFNTKISEFSIRVKEENSESDHSVDSIKSSSNIRSIKNNKISTKKSILIYNNELTESISSYSKHSEGKYYHKKSSSKLSEEDIQTQKIKEYTKNIFNLIRNTQESNGNKQLKFNFLDWIVEFVVNDFSSYYSFIYFFTHKKFNYELCSWILTDLNDCFHSSLLEKFHFAEEENFI